MLLSWIPILLRVARIPSAALGTGLPTIRRRQGVEGVPPSNRGLEARDTIDAFETRCKMGFL
jgi:hypothetical protein